MEELLDSSLVQSFSSAVAPTLTIEEQPVQFYRFRYESEIEKDSSKVGGLLLGRSSKKTSKSFMKVRVSGIDPAVHTQLRLMVCTVSAEEKAPHPYYLHGDYCKDGYYELKKSVDSNFKGSDWEVTFERLAVICIPKKKQEIKKAMEARLRNFPENFNYESRAADYKANNLDPIRLSFLLAFTDIRGQEWLLSPKFSDEIASKKEERRIEIDSLNPAEIPKDGGCLVAIYTSRPTTGIQKSCIKVNFTVTCDDNGRQMVFVSEVNEVKKHLLMVKSPYVSHISGNDRLKSAVTVLVKEFESKAVNIIFLGRATFGPPISSSKNNRKRAPPK